MLNQSNFDLNYLDIVLFNEYFEIKSANIISSDELGRSISHPTFFNTLEINANLNKKIFTLQNSPLGINVQLFKDTVKELVLDRALIFYQFMK